MTCLIIFLMLNISFVFSQTLPEGLTIKEDYSPGIGLPLGKIVLVQGKAVIIHHHNTQVGYEAKKELPLYQKDKLITLDTGRISFQLNDGSQMSMASNATMTINKSVFDPIQKDRTIFMNMPKGKSRFTVKKLKNFKRSAVKIKTTTAIIGVRGSDFIVMASEQNTEIVTLDQTVLEVNSLFDPSAQAVLLQAFERSEVEIDALPSLPETVRPEEIDGIMEEFSFSMETASNVNTPESQTNSNDKQSKQPTKSSEKETSGTSKSEPKSIDSKPSESKIDESKSGGTTIAKIKPSQNQIIKEPKQADTTIVEEKPLQTLKIEPQTTESMPVEPLPAIMPASTSFEPLPVLMPEHIIEAPEPIETEMPASFEPQLDIENVRPDQEISIDAVQELQDDIVEEKTEDEFKGKLPGLPAKPSTF